MSTRRRPQAGRAEPAAPADLPEGEHLSAASSADSVSDLEEDRPADVRQVGVGPWPGGREAWPTDPCYDRELLDWAAASGYEVIGIDNGPGARPLEATALPERCLMVFGSEGEGISAELSAGCASLLRIGQYGSTRSINVAAAAAVAMHTWILQHAGPAPD